MIARSRLAMLCRRLAAIEEPIVGDIDRPALARLREAGLVEHGRYRLTGDWSRLMVQDGRGFRAVEERDPEWAICRALEAGPLRRGEITAIVPEGGTTDRALRCLCRDGYLLGPDDLELTPAGRALAEVSDG